MRQEVRAFSVTLPSGPATLSAVRGFVESAGQVCGLEQSIVHAMVLAAGEAVTNILRHGHRDVPLAQIELKLRVEKDALELVFEDQGEPFDLAAVPHLQPGELRLGGRGVYMMRSLMDEVSCRARGPGERGNVLRMIKRLTPRLP